MNTEPACDTGYDHVCEKCGWIHNKYPPYIEYAYGEFYEKLQKNIFLEISAEEYFIRECQCCGFKWAEDMPEKPIGWASQDEWFFDKEGKKATPVTEYTKYQIEECWSSVVKAKSELSLNARFDCPHCGKGVSVCATKNIEKS